MIAWGANIELFSTLSPSATLINIGCASSVAQIIPSMSLGDLMKPIEASWHVLERIFSLRNGMTWLWFQYGRT